MKKEAIVNQNKIEREDMTLLRAPGYVYDLLFVFYLNFNLEVLANNADDETHSSNEELFDFLKNEIRPYFGEIHDDLYVFFHALEHGRCLLTTKYFNSNKLKDLSFENFCKDVANKDELIRNLISFYFYDLDAEAAKAYADSQKELFALIKNSAYSAEEKSKLYEFFADPDYYIDLLIKELEKKEKLLAEYYDEKYSLATDLFGRISLQSISESMEKVQCKDCYKMKNADFYLSVCLINKQLVLHKWSDTDVFIIVGCEYEKMLENEKMGRIPDLKGLGCVLAEESRVKILAYMLKAGEVVCKDLEKNFSFSGSTAYHHLTMMCRVGIVKFRLSGKTVLYSINKTYVDRVLGVLLDYSSYKDVSEIK